LLRTLRIPYGQGELSFQLPGDLEVREARLNSLPEIDTQAELARALAEPIASPPLEELAAGAKSVLIICDDNTRPTPAHLILPAMLARLEAAGVERGGISILIAGGSHRPMTEDELRAKVGHQVFESVPVFNHEYANKEKLVYLGDTANGTPIWINKMVFEADLVLAVGGIVPHRYCGWSGGGKIIQPGVCGEETTIATHLMITKDESITLGNIDNPVRAEIDEIALKAGLKFIVNVIMDADQRVVGLVAGDPIKAHRSGVEIAKQVYGVAMQRADLVIISSFPADLNFWQAGKALYSADLAVQQGGRIILVTPAIEGPGEHLEFLTLMSRPYEEIMAAVERGEVEDKIGAAGALAVALVKQRAQVKLVSDGLTDEQCAWMGFPHYAASELQQAVDEALAELGGRPTINVIHEGAEILPLLDR